ncbi:MAG: hypothetical protein ACFFDH_15780, partial [Promethearchaeota archaeon]
MNGIILYFKRIKKKKSKRIIFIATIFCFFLSLMLLSSIKTNFTANSESANDKLIYREYAFKSSPRPVLLINSPINYTSFSNIAPNFSLTIIDGIGKYYWYEFLESGESSAPIKLNGIPKENISNSFDQILWNKLSNGDVRIRFYVVNSIGKLGYADITIKIEIIKQTINLSSSSTNSFNSTTLGFIVQIWMTLMYVFIFFRRYIKKNVENLYFCLMILFFFLFFFSIIINLNIKNYDSNEYDHLIFDENSLKLSTAPSIQINSPINYSLYGKIAPNFSITIVDGLANYTWYEFIDTGEISNPIELKGEANEILIGTFNQSLWDKLTNGTKTIRFYANNTLGEIGHTDVIVRIDAFTPTVIINSPTNNTNWNSPPPINVTTFDPNFDSLWYRVGTTNITLTNNTEELLDINIWNSLLQGEFQIYIYANDSLGNLNDTYIIIGYKDTIAPTIMINSPTNNTYWNSPPSINITVFDPNFDSLWYRVGTTNITLTNNTEELLDTNIWNSLPQGEFQIHIYANDSFGYLNDTYIITGYKDTIAPTVVINSPTNNIYWNSPPPINITVFDPNFESLWYRVGTTNILLTNNTEELLDINIWNSLLQGVFQIYIYTNDSFGYLNDTYVITGYKDTIAPVLQINSPTNNIYWNSPPP